LFSTINKLKNKKKKNRPYTARCCREICCRLWWHSNRPYIFIN